MVKKYPWQAFAYEYAEWANTYVVTDEIWVGKEYECYANDYIAFSKKMEQLFGDEAPLFSDTNRLFTLSDQAQSYPVIHKKQEPLLVTP